MNKLKNVTDTELLEKLILFTDFIECGNSHCENCPIFDVCDELVDLNSERYNT